MSVLRILQIGDVHFPDKKNQNAPVDAKDPSFPPQISKAVGSQPLTAVSRKLTKIIEDTAPSAIAFMGDFTDRGDPKGLADSVQFLSGVLPPDWSRDLKQKSITCIGNHDIARANTSSPRLRFEDVNRILTAGGFPEAAIDTPVHLDCANRHVNARLYGLNSCIGCGETRFIPTMLEPAVNTALRSLISGSANPSILDQLIEEIDTPVIDENAIGELVSMIKSSPPQTLNIVCGHHNILPQATPRIAPYTELLNAGAFRNSLLSTERPIIYLHGHIHTDPYEIILSPRYQRSSIISISAPVLRDGFNLIEFEVDSGGTPLGVRIRPFRRVGNNVEETQNFEISLRSTASALVNITREGRDLAAMLVVDKTTYYSDVKRDCSLASDLFDRAFSELVWLGVILILNKEAPENQWRVTRAL